MCDNITVHHGPWTHIDEIFRPHPIRYLYQPSKPLETPEKLQLALGLDKLPKIRLGHKQPADDSESSDEDYSDNCLGHGSSERDAELFVELDESQKDAIKGWLTRHGCNDTVRFILIDKAFGTFSDRHADDNTSTNSICDYFPRTYFFYGSLKSPEKLSSVTEQPISEIEPNIRSAYVEVYTQVKLGQYIGIAASCAVGLPTTKSRAHGIAYDVQSPEEEDMLATYETRYYEVAAISINVETGEHDKQVKSVPGFAFVAAGMA